MLRWIFGGREAQNSAEKSGVLRIGEEQPKNCFTELQVLKGHFDIVRFLVQIDDFRCASAGDDGLVLIWNVETGERLRELRGHSRQITAVAVLRRGDVRLVTASSDRTVSLWDPDTGNRLRTVRDLQSSVKCILALPTAGTLMSGGDQLCVWSDELRLRCVAETHRHAGISSLIELPDDRVAAAVERRLVIYKLTAHGDALTVVEVGCQADHRDHIRALVNVNDRVFASGSLAGEIILWDALDCSVLAYQRILWEEPESATMAHEPVETSVRHLASNGNLVAAAVGSGVYVLSAATGAALAYRKRAHDSDVLHTALLSDSELMSCSEDGSVRMWDIRELPLAAEPASAGFFGMWTSARSSKQTCAPSKKSPEPPAVRTLELTGDLIGHSGAVQMFLAFPENGLLTCSADRQLILWKNGERQSRLRGLALFRKLEENGGL
ncbi:WD repeat-containing protein 41 isoform X2 [Syngnathoides biaculeatus]|uniref:WD repeat-containing protein 41 isoform X2 n=1 Tax=Syngnathoides biaculeatus TaxID=300417 RepID=UPI002ADE5760|nr:WD repeat-containing protein 41 isoform X2 [Syngnathoides biaculeatus]XP_061658070.1 WD repeat-containing protein 41 isoform X2 [Syngnathoides biaculeatus]